MGYKRMIDTLIIIPTDEKRKDKYSRLQETIRETGIGAITVTYKADGKNGFTIAVNEGLKTFYEGLYIGKGIKYIWILNDDTTVFPDTLSESIKFMEEHPKCGLMGHQNLLMSDPDLIIWGGSGNPFPAGQHKFGKISLGDLREPTLEKWVTFSSVFIRAEVVRDIGLLDPNMVWVYSDSDYSYRARAFGWECWYNPKAKILHEKGVSGKPPKELINRFKLDQIYFHNKWINGKLYYDLDSELLNQI
jgi:GT2 family glycosyltransferase